MQKKIDDIEQLTAEFLHAIDSAAAHACITKAEWLRSASRLHPRDSRISGVCRQLTIDLAAIRASAHISDDDFEPPLARQAKSNVVAFTTMRSSGERIPITKEDEADDRRWDRAQQKEQGNLFDLFGGTK